MRTAKAQISCSSALSNQVLRCLLTESLDIRECINGEQITGMRLCACAGSESVHVRKHIFAWRGPAVIGMYMVVYWIVHVKPLKLMFTSFNSFGAKFQTTFVVWFSFFSKLLLEKKSIHKVERLNVKQHRSG